MTSGMTWLYLYFYKKYSTGTYTFRSTVLGVAQAYTVQYNVLVQAAPVSCVLLPCG